MATSLMIHDVTSVTTDGTIFYGNSNSVTLRISTRNDGELDITVFDLAKEDAEHLSHSLSRYPERRFNEAAIRADERAKVTARLASLIGEAA